MAEINGTYVGELYPVSVGNRKYTIYAYFPEGMKSGDALNASFYWPGACGYYGNPGEYLPISNYYTSNENVNYVFFTFGGCIGHDGYSQEAINQVIATIEEEKNISIDINRINGLSAGGDEAVRHTLNMLHNDAAAVQQKMILYDPYSSDSGFGFRLTEDDIAVMQNNETQSVMFIADWRRSLFTNPSYTEGAFATTLAANGLETIIIDGHFVHGDTTKRAASDGWVDYFNGYIDIEDIYSLSYDGEKYTDSLNYKISVPVIQSNGSVSWTTYTLAELVDAKVHPNNYSKEDLDVRLLALSQLDDLRVETKESLIWRAENLLNQFSSFLDSTPKISEYTSTSRLIPESFDALTKAHDVACKMMNSLQKEISNILYAGDKYTEMDEQLKVNANELNELFKDDLEDLRTKYIPLEVEIDDPELNIENTTTSTNYTNKINYSSNSQYQNIEQENVSEFDDDNDDDLSNTDNLSENVEENSIEDLDVPSNNENNYNNSYTNRQNTFVRPIVTQNIVTNSEDTATDDMDSAFGYDSLSDDKTDAVINDGVEPTIIPSNNNISHNNVKKSNSGLKMVGTLLAAGAVTAAGVYAGKKYIDSRNNDEIDDDEEDNDYGFDDTPKNNDEI